jgi:hypothetical protein
MFHLLIFERFHLSDGKQGIVLSGIYGNILQRAILLSLVDSRVRLHPFFDQLQNRRFQKFELLF